MKKQLLIFAALALTVTGNAQKRNMFPAYNFEVTGENIISDNALGRGPLLIRECSDGGNIKTEIASGISGNSLKIEVIALPAGKVRWDNAVKYLAEVNSGDQLEIRFKAKASTETAFDFEIWNVIGTGTGILANQKVEVGTEVKEYVFQTVASEGNSIQRLTFQFGENSAVGDIFYFDDLSIVKLNTDWDGNLIRNGGFEINTLDYNFMTWSGNEQFTTSFDDTDVLGSGQSLKWTNAFSSGDGNSNLKSHYIGPGIQYKISLKAKNSGQETAGNKGGIKIGVGRTWDISSSFFPIGTWKGDGYKWLDDLLVPVPDNQYVYESDEALDRDGYNNHLIFNMGWYPAGDIWFDNLKVEQIGLKSIEIVEWEKDDDSALLWINAYPSSADNKVEWTIDPSSTGEASIDEDGLMTVTKSGNITVNAKSKLNPAVTTSETFSFELPTSIKNQELNNTVIECEYYSITGIKVGSSKENLKEGIYICKEKYGNGTVKKSKIYVDKK